MSPEETLRSAFTEIEDSQSPISVGEVIGRSTGDVSNFARSSEIAPGDPRPRRGWMLIAATITGLLAGLGALLVADRSATDEVASTATETLELQDGNSATSGVASGPDERPAVIAPDGDPAGPSNPVIVGGAIEFVDGGALRVNRVIPEATSRYERYAADGSTLTEVEIEWCAGTDASPVDAAANGGVPVDAGLTPEQWTGVLDDGTTVAAIPSYWLAFSPAPGGCVRGYLGFATPPGQALIEVRSEMTSRHGLIGPRTDTWDLTDASPIGAPLSGALEPDRTPVGQSMDLDLCADQATVLSVERVTTGPDVDRLAAGRELWEITGELCATTAVHEFALDTFWLISTRDNYVGNATGESNNGWDPEFADLPRQHAEYLWRAGGLEVDGEPFVGPMLPGECVRGTVRIELPAGSVPEDVVVTQGREHYQEIGRTTLRER